jgi:hypothetical protein
MAIFWAVMVWAVVDILDGTQFQQMVCAIATLILALVVGLITKRQLSAGASTAGGGS